MLVWLSYTNRRKNVAKSAFWGDPSPELAPTNKSLVLLLRGHRRLASWWSLDRGVSLVLRSNIINIFDLSVYVCQIYAFYWSRDLLWLFKSPSPPHPISEILTCFFAFSTSTIEILLLHQYCLYTCIIEKGASLIFKHSIASIWTHSELFWGHQIVQKCSHTFWKLIIYQTIYISLLLTHDNWFNIL